MTNIIFQNKNIIVNKAYVYICYNMYNETQASV